MVGSVALMLALMATGRLDPGPRSHSPLVELLDSLAILALIPVAFALHRLLRRSAPVLMDSALLLGLGGLALAGALHLMFVFELAWFSEAFTPLLVAAAAVIAWIWIVALVGRRYGRLPNAVVMALAATTLIGFPIWAAWAGTRLLTGSHASRHRDLPLP